MVTFIPFFQANKRLLFGNLPIRIYQCRGLSVFYPKLAKVHQENENEYALSVLRWSFLHENIQNSTLNNCKTVPPNLSDISLVTNSSFRKFLTISSEVRGCDITIEDPTFSDLVKSLVTEIPSMCDEKIIGILSALRWWPPTESTRTPNFMTLWNALDHECTVRCIAWTNDQLLQVAYLWFCLKLSRISRYNRAMLEILGKQIDSLPISSVVQLLFFINVQRRAPSFLMSSIEKVLLKDIATLTLDDMSVVALGFFKSQTTMKNEELIKTIIDKIEHDLDTSNVNELTLAALAKLLRYSMPHSCLNIYRNFQRKLVPLVHKYQPSTLTHLAQLGIVFAVCDTELLTQIVKRFAHNLRKEVRLKEVAKILYCLAMFMPTHKISYDYCIQVVEDLKSQYQDEIIGYPASFISILLYMAYMNVYPKQLIEMCLSTSFLKRAEESSKVNIFREVYVLDSSVEIECKDYDGVHLPKSLKAELFKKFHVIPSGSNNHQEKFMLDVYNHLVVILGSEKYCLICHILPHFKQKDILIMSNKSNNFMEITADVRTTQPGSIIIPPLNEKWYAIVTGGRSFYQRDQHQPTGASLMKLRQLQKLGYTVVEVPWFIYTNLHERQKDRYLQMMIFN